jgi:hypothetical protein
MRYLTTYRIGYRGDMGPAPLAFALCLVIPDLATRQEGAGRPVIEGARTHLSADGRFKIHYALEGAAALPLVVDDDPANGVPDVIDWVEEGATRMVEVFGLEDGWPPPPPDEGRGGDDRLDIYVHPIDANGYAHLEILPSGRLAGWIEIDPAPAAMGRAAFASITGHEVHHILELAIARGFVSMSPRRPPPTPSTLSSPTGCSTSGARRCGSSASPGASGPCPDSAISSSTRGWSG